MVPPPADTKPGESRTFLRRLRGLIITVLLLGGCVTCYFGGGFYDEFIYAQMRAKLSLARSRMVTVGHAIRSADGEPALERATAGNVISVLRGGQEGYAEVVANYYTADTSWSEWSVIRPESFRPRQFTARDAPGLMNDPFARPSAPFVISELASGDHLIMSAGPNGIIDSDLNPMSPLLIPYDPTNGCFKTAGDIWLTVSSLSD